MAHREKSLVGFLNETQLSVMQEVIADLNCGNRSRFNDGQTKINRR